MTVAALSEQNAATLERFGVQGPKSVSEFRMMRDTLNDLLDAIRDEERKRAAVAVKAEAYRYAEFYPPLSDGWNTFVIFGDAAERIVGGEAVHEQVVQQPRDEPISCSPKREAVPVINEEPPALYGYTYHNPDTGLEWAENHPVESGEVSDATDIRPATAAEAAFAQGWYAALSIPRPASDKGEEPVAWRRRPKGSSQAWGMVPADDTDELEFYRSTERYDIQPLYARLSTGVSREEVARAIGDSFSPNLTFDTSSIATRVACFRAADAVLALLSRGEG